MLAELGHGGMGAVYKARQEKFDRVVALKLIRPERLTDESAIQRFRREIRASAKLDHPNIIRAFDADEINGVHFFTMEYVEGVDLAKEVKEHGPLPVKTACDYIRQAALGLQHAHERGMVHRDIKPSNLLVARRARSVSEGSGGPLANAAGSANVIKILDMGLARFESAGNDDTSSMLTSTGMVMGTPDFLAPEQTRDSKSVDIRADLYSLGCTLYFLLVGRVPFPGNFVGEKLVKHQLDEPTPIEQLRADVPPRVAAVVRKLMAKKPEDRYQTPAELAVALADAELLKPDATQKFQSPPAASPAPLPVPDSVTKTESLVAEFHRRRGAREAAQLKVLLTISLGVPAVIGIAVLLWSFHGTPQVAPAPATKPAAQAKAPTKPPATKPTTPAPQQTEEQTRKQREADAEKAFPALEAKFKAADVSFASFAKDIAAFKAKHGGTPAAVAAAEMLMKLPSPLDALDPKNIPAEERYPWQPRELVCVIGFHATPLTAL